MLTFLKSATIMDHSLSGLMEADLLREFYVYTHSRVTDGTVFYVGKGKGSRATVRRGRSQYWHRVVAKHGCAVSIVSSGHTEAEAFAIEVSMIAKLRADGVRLVNSTNGGDGTSGYKYTPEQRAIISAKQKGQKIGPPSAEHRAKISAAKKGKPRPKEVCEIIGNIWRGKTLSAEHRAKFSAALKGNNNASGTVHTDEYRATKSIAYTGIGNPFFGKKHSAETRAALSKSAKERGHWIGKKHSEETIRKMATARSAYWARRRAEKQAAAACSLAPLSPSAAATGRTGD